MKNKKADQNELTQQETRLLEQLRKHPQMMVRVQSILEIARNAEGPLKTADEVEELLIDEMRQLGNLTLSQWAIQAEERVSQELKSLDSTVRSRKKKTLKWWCVFGSVEVRERIWRSQTKNYLRPLPKRLGVTPRGRSRRLDRVLTDFGCEHSFARAAESVREHYGFEIGASAVRTATLEHAGRARERLREEYQQPFRELPAVGAEHVIAETDGTMICTVESGPRKGKRPREWKEMRLVAAQAKDSATTVYAATFGSVEETGRRWGHCARQAGWGLNSQIHAVGDGAEWIRLQSQEVFGEQGVFLCDFFHVSEYLGAAAIRCRPSQPNPWRTTQQQRLRRGAVQKVIEALAPHLEPEGTADEEAPVRNGYRYLNNRLDCLDYPRALQLGLPIGSGLIESGHRHVLHARLKKAGTAWLRDHADQMAHLRVLRANHQWQSFWN
jgi:uncharacterized protein UPF0236